MIDAQLLADIVQTEFGQRLIELIKDCPISIQPVPDNLGTTTNIFTGVRGKRLVFYIRPGTSSLDMMLSHEVSHVAASTPEEFLSTNLGLKDGSVPEDLSERQRESEAQASAFQVNLILHLARGEEWGHRISEGFIKVAPQFFGIESENELRNMVASQDYSFQAFHDRWKARLGLLD